MDHVAVADPVAALQVVTRSTSYPAEEPPASSLRPTPPVSPEQTPMCRDASSAATRGHAEPPPSRRAPSLIAHDDADALSPLRRHPRAYRASTLSTANYAIKTKRRAGLRHRARRSGKTTQR